MIKFKPMQDLAMPEGEPFLVLRHHHRINRPC